MILIGDQPSKAAMVRFCAERALRTWKVSGR